MCEERILQAMTEISGEYIQEADPNLVSTVSRKRRPLRTVLTAAAVAALMVTTALAVGLLGGWEAFFGRVPDQVTTPVGVSAASGDYTITLEETISGEDGAAFLLSLRRTDGGVLEGEPALYGRHLVIEDMPSNIGYSNQKPVPSEDGKRIYYCFRFDRKKEGVETLANHKIILSYEGVIDKEWTEEEEKAVRLETVSLAPLAPVVEQAQVNFPVYADMEDPDFVTAMDQMEAAAVPGTIPLSLGGGEVCSLAGGVLSKDGRTLAIALRWPDEWYRNGKYLTNGANTNTIALTDTRTGERVDTDAACWGGSREENYFVDLFELDRPLTLEDLPYLEATVRYDTIKYLSDEPFQLAFTVDDSGYSKEYALDQQAEVAEAYCLYRYSLHLTSLRVSALELRLYFDDVQSAERKPGEYTTGKLIYRDGRELELSGGPGWASQMVSDTYIAFRPKGNILFDPDQAAAVQLGDTRIDLK